MIKSIYAQLACARLETSIGWFSKLFGRAPDARPMNGLAEWHHADCAGLQLFEDASNAGHGTLTLMVDSIATERARVLHLGLQPDAVQKADYTQVTQMRDPDGNRVVLAEMLRPA